MGNCYTFIRCSLLAVMLGGSACHSAWAADEFEIEQNGKKRFVVGQVIVEAQDGGVLLLAADGLLWPLQPREILKRNRTNDPFQPLKPAELSRALLAELPGHQVHATAHYVIVHNTSKAYAQWCGALFERLYRAFHTYWTERGVKLHEPGAPLVALVFDSQTSYAKHALAEVGPAATGIIGYYSLHNNRVHMYDLTGVESFREGVRGGTSAVRINEVLSRPEAARMVATVIHEATHQLAYNCGLMTRYTTNPLWASEGVAMYFETPDLESTKGWKNVGGVNPPRLVTFHEYLARRPADSLATLLQDNERFGQGGQTSLDAYAEAWALNYYLLRTRPNDYVKYLQALNARAPLAEETNDERLQAFTKTFGDDLEKFDADFVQYVRRLK